MVLRISTLMDLTCVVLIHTNPLLYSHPRLSLTKTTVLHNGGAQKEVKIHRNKDMNLAVRAGELAHLLYIAHNGLASQGKGLLLNKVSIHRRLAPLSLETIKDEEI